MDRKENDLTIGFRVDMNKHIATGHMMRCLSIADEAKRQGMKTIFFCADDKGLNILKDRDHDACVLGTYWGDLNAEIDVFIRELRKQELLYLFIDSYSVTSEYLKAISSEVFTIYIDDLNSFHYPVNAILNYEIYAQKLGYETEYLMGESYLLLGANYAPLRQEFKTIAEHPKAIRSNIENILVLSGGADPYGTIEQVLDVFIDYDMVNIVAICGRYSDKIDDLRNKYQDKTNIVIKRNVSNIETYMVNADLCISAGGSTLYELCSCGTPTISYTLADNQVENAKGFDEEEIIPYLGDVRNMVLSESLLNHIQSMKSKEQRKSYSQRMQSIVDGRGCERILDYFANKVDKYGMKGSELYV